MSATWKEMAARLRALAQLARDADEEYELRTLADECEELTAEKSRELVP
jgi:hypothetical protein